MLKKVLAGLAMCGLLAAGQDRGWALSAFEQRNAEKSAGQSWERLAAAEAGAAGGIASKNALSQSAGTLQSLGNSLAKSAELSLTAQSEIEIFQEAIRSRTRTTKLKPGTVTRTRTEKTESVTVQYTNGDSMTEVYARPRGADATPIYFEQTTKLNEVIAQVGGYTTKITQVKVARDASFNRTLTYTSVTTGNGTTTTSVYTFTQKPVSTWTATFVDKRFPRVTQKQIGASYDDGTYAVHLINNPSGATSSEMVKVGMKNMTHIRYGDFHQVQMIQGDVYTSR